MPSGLWRGTRTADEGTRKESELYCAENPRVAGSIPALSAGHRRGNGGGRRTIDTRTAHAALTGTLYGVSAEVSGPP